MSIRRLITGLIFLSMPLFAASFGENSDLPNPPALKSDLIGTKGYKDSYTYQKFTKFILLPAYGFGYRERHQHIGFDVTINVAPYVIYNLVESRVAALFYLNKLSKTSSPYIGIGGGGFGSYETSRGVFHGGVTGDLLIGIENEKGFWEIDFAIAHYLDNTEKGRFFKKDTFPFISISKGWRF